MTQTTESNEQHLQNPAVQHSDDLQPVNDIIDYAKQYAREKPQVAALWCFGIGFLLGWKIKPW